MLDKIPSDIEKFNDYIRKTDDCQLALTEHNVYHVNEDGKTDYSRIEKKELKEPAWERWGWTEEESRQWSLFRQQQDELYNAAGKKQELLNKNISDCIEYSREHRIFERLMRSGQIYGSEREIFGIQQDVLQYQTPLRAISILYEKQIPLSDFEKKFIEKYIALHHRVPESAKQLLSEIKELQASLKELWERMPVAKEKADKASNSICLPSPEMKGSYSPMVQVYIPTAEEAQQRADDFNRYSKALNENINKMIDKSNVLYEQVYGENDDGESTDPLFHEVDKMESELVQNWDKYSMDISSLDDDWQDFLGAMNEAEKEILPAWEKYSNEQNVLLDAYNALVDFLNARFRGEEDNAETTPDETSSGETDDLREETIKRYQSDLKLKTNTYFDVADWHIVLDHYEQNRDEKNISVALARAFEQHPNHPELLIRRAQQEAGKHEYQKALEFFKQAETQGGAHHPNFYLFKGDVLCQMHAHEQAIPLYEKLLKAEGPGVERLHEKARWRLLEAFEEKKNYSQCLRLSKELLEMNPDNEEAASNIGHYYCALKKFAEAEQALKEALEKFPESDTCLAKLGHVYFQSAHYEKAAEQLQKAYEQNKNENYTDLAYKGEALMALKKFDEAALCFETCLLYYELDKNWHLQAGKCYAQLNIPHAAAQHFRRALAIDRECEEAVQQLQKLNLKS